MTRFILVICFILVNAIAFAQVYTSQGNYFFNIQYFQNENKIETDETISLRITGNKWKHSTKQLEGIWTYFVKPGTPNLFSDQWTIGWLNIDSTGIIDDDLRTWLHPPRNNQYALTELAPFPDFRKKSNVGDTYDVVLYIGYGFGEWTDKEIKSYYTVSDKTELLSDTTYTIDATSFIDDHVNKLRFKYSSHLGFTSLEYDFYNGDRLTMTLEK